MYCNPGTVDDPSPSIMLQLNLTIAGTGIPLTKTSTEQAMLYILYGSIFNTRGVTFLKATDKVGAVCVWREGEQRERKRGKERVTIHYFTY